MTREDASPGCIEKSCSAHELRLQAGVGNTPYLQPIDAGEHHGSGQVRADTQPVLRIGGQNELAPPQTIRRPGQRDPLDLAA
jgi:hypothetical protein